MLAFLVQLWKLLISAFMRVWRPIKGIPPSPTEKYLEQSILGNGDLHLTVDACVGDAL